MIQFLDCTPSRQTLGIGLMILMFVTGAAAQINTAEIAGVVKDTSGGVLPGATVTAKHAASGTMVERVTDGEGRFFLPALRIGQWDVTVTMSGFAPQTLTLALEIGRTLAFDFSLRVRASPSRSPFSRPHPFCKRPTRRSATSSGTARSSRCR